MVGRVPYYFSRVPVTDMIPIKGTHTHPLLRIPAGGGPVWQGMLSPGLWIMSTIAEDHDADSCIGPARIAWRNSPRPLTDPETIMP